MNEEFQQALRAGDLEAIRRFPKTDLQAHAGEWGDADSVWRAVEDLSSTRFSMGSRQPTRQP